MYDLIGDIHGHADELIELLGRMGYKEVGGIYRDSQRRVIFVGDFIDRGPQIREVLEIAFYSPPINCTLPLPESVVRDAAPYSTSSVPVFFGHYWLRAVRPSILRGNVACIDYSVANDGFLCAYRWNGERELNNNNFEWVEAKIAHSD